MTEPSPEIRKNRAIRRLRVALLAATVLAVVAVVALYLAGRTEPSSPTAEDLGPETMEPAGEYVTVGEGFERTISEGDEPRFTVRGERYAVDREGIVHLEDVRVTIYREEGSQYEVEGAEARFDIEEQEGRLGGGVRIVAPDDMELTTEQLRISHGGQQVRSGAPVEFRIGDDYRGQAAGLRAWLGASRFLLEGFVRVVSLPGAEEPLRLETEDLLLDRGRNLARTRKWAVLRRRGERISALSLDLFFAADEATLRFVRAESEVMGALRSGPGGSLEGAGPAATEDDDDAPALEGIRRLVFRTDKLTLLMTEDGRHPQKLDLEGGPDGLAVLRAVGSPGAPTHRLTAPVITGWYEGGAPTRAEATGGVVLVAEDPAAAAEPIAAEEPGAPSDRRATARRADAAFGAEGSLTTVTMEGDVVLTDGAVEATGERGIFQVEEDTAELLGRPAVATTERGRMEAPRILYTRESGLVHGTDGVRARLDEARESSLAGSPLARGEGPIWVEAREGFFRDEPRAFLFLGKVRAWRGEDLLVSDELRGDEPENRLVATGSVRSLWTPKEGDEGTEAPLEATADEMVYRSAERVLVYTGDVVATQEGRTVACDEMVVMLAEEGGMDELVCTGDVRLDDPAQGRSLRGARAVYDPVARTVDVEGAEDGKVTMTDREGNVIEGPRMIYDIDNDRVRVVGRRDGRPADAPPATAPDPGAP